MNKLIFLAVVISLSEFGNAKIKAEENKTKEIVIINKRDNNSLLLLKEFLLYDKPKISDAKIIGKCPSDSIVEYEKGAYVKKVINGKKKTDIMNFVTCESKQGWISYDPVFVEMNKRGYLIENKERVKLSRLFSAEISGSYHADVLSITVDDRDQYNINVVINGPSMKEGVFPNYKRLQKEIWEISNNETNLIVSYSKAGLKVEVVKDATGKFKKIHNKVFPVVNPSE